MKQVIQLDDAGYFVGITAADYSPLEAGVLLLPAGAVDTDTPIVPEGKRAKWNGSWVLEDIPEPEPQPNTEPLTYAQMRVAEYPRVSEYLDGLVKGDQAQINKYIADCMAVKAKYPKPAQ